MRDSDPYRCAHHNIMAIIHSCAILKLQGTRMVILISILYMSTLRVDSVDPHVHANITSILNTLLDYYDSNLYPTYGDGPTTVYVSMMIRSMGPISEADMSYSMEAYFRQIWQDKRLKYKGPMKLLAVDNKMLNDIWTPDTYFHNGKKSYRHEVTTPNRLLRIREDGTVLLSKRLTIRAQCPMDLQNFPLDLQRCPLQFGSFGYTKDQVIYKWKYGVFPIRTARDLQLSQYALGKIETSELIVRDVRGELSSLKVIFPLRRHAGYFLIQMYFPCIMIVILSWINFWIQREATADRIGLGVTAVLTLTTLRLDTSMPKVSYATALDLYFILCLICVMATILEFWGVHYFTKKGSGERECDSEDEEECKHAVETHWPTHRCHAKVSKCGNRNYSASNERRRGKKHNDGQNVLMKLLYCVVGSYRYRKQNMRRAHSVNSISKIDKVSRIVFPMFFIVINIIYFWYFRIQDLIYGV